MITVVRCCARNARIVAIIVQRRDRLRTSSGTVSGSSARTYFGQMAIAKRHYRRRRTRMLPSFAIGGLVIRAGDTVVIRRMYSVPEHITLFGPARHSWSRAIRRSWRIPAAAAYRARCGY